MEKYKKKLILIKLDKSTVNSLKEVREYPRQTYNELIKHMVQVFKGVKKKNQYDEFLHKIQQAKMKELWENKYDSNEKNKKKLKNLKE